jgi:glutamate synthase domain-containing protein 3
MGLHEEVLSGKSRDVFFDSEEDQNYLYDWAYSVNLDSMAEVDAADLSANEFNLRIRQLLEEGIGTIVVHNPGAKHSLGVGILNRLNLRFEGSLGYFGLGCLDGPNVRITGRVGWSCAENMLAGTVVVEKNAGSSFGAALRGGDLVCMGDVGARTGIDMKGGSIIVGGRAGLFTGFMMQRGRIVVLGDTGKNLGDSMYDGIIYVGGDIASLGVDAIPGEMTDLDVQWLERKLSHYGLQAPNGIENLQKIVSGKTLWNYDSLEPHEKKIAL